MKLPRHAELWFPGYARDRLERLVSRAKTKRLWVTITDHYEPLGGKAPLETAIARVRRWQDRWPLIASQAPRDAKGNLPCYTFFYPQEEYRAELLAPLAEMSRSGIADVEVHIHHDRETKTAFEEKIRSYCRRLRDDHGLLHEEDGRIVFGFIHGNWALDNSRPDGLWCGLPGEIPILRDLGCYADFTMPSAPSPTQSRIVNQIYWCTGGPGKSRSFDSGVRATIGGGVRGDMLMISGPLGMRYGERRLPRMEMGEIAANDPPAERRVKGWLSFAPRIGEDQFLKLFTHGAQEANAGALLDGGLSNLFRWLREAAVERGIEPRWVSAFQMYRAVKELVNRKT